MADTPCINVQVPILQKTVDNAGLTKTRGAMIGECYSTLNSLFSTDLEKLLNSYIIVTFSDGAKQKCPLSLGTTGSNGYQFFSEISYNATNVVIMVFVTTSANTGRCTIWRSTESGATDVSTNKDISELKLYY